MVKSGKFITVPKGTVKQFRDAGWQRFRGENLNSDEDTPISPQNSPEIDESENYPDTDTTEYEASEDESSVCLSETPLTEMTTEQLRAYAEELKLQLPTGLSKRQLREALKKYLEERV